MIREADPADHAAAARSLAAAFMDDPVAIWSSPREAPRERMLTRFFTAYLRHKQPHGLVWTTEDRAGTAIWAPPGAGTTSGREDLDVAKAMLDPRLAWRAPLIGWGLLGVERRHPRTPPHLYLAAIGVAPSAQGRGLGSKLLAPALEICDRDAVPAYLESSKESNIDFYARHGFVVTEEIALPRGPTVYAMWREPSAH